MSYVLCTSVRLIQFSVQYSLLSLEIAVWLSESEVVTADATNHLGCGSVLKKQKAVCNHRQNFLILYTIIQLKTRKGHTVKREVTETNFS